MNDSADQPGVPGNCRHMLSMRTPFAYWVSSPK